MNEKILTNYKTSDVVGCLNLATINKTNKTPVKFNVNDNNTNTYAYTNPYYIGSLKTMMIYTV